MSNADATNTGDSKRGLSEIALESNRGPLWELLSRTMDHQERTYGPFVGDVAGVRLGLAVLADELAEALEAWRDERRTNGWPELHVEVMQLAAVACRLLMDSGLPEASIAWRKVNPVV